MCEDREGDRGYVYVWRTGCMGVYKRKEKKSDRETGGWGCTVYLAVALQLLWIAMPARPPPLVVAHSQLLGVISISQGG